MKNYNAMLPNLRQEKYLGLKVSRVVALALIRIPAVT